MGDAGPGTTLASNGPAPWPGPSVHDQQTVTSLPSEGAPPWAAPSAGPFAPPNSASPATPDPFAPPPVREPVAVPPPPVAPDGPGQVPYGYPGPVGYGYPGPQAPGPYGWTGMPPLPSNGMGTAGLVLGIVSAVGFCLWPLAIIIGVLGVVFGALGRAKARRGEATNGGHALAGLICGIVGIALGVGFGALVIFAP